MRRTIKSISHGKMEDALRQSEKRYRSYIEVTGQLGWTTNADGEVVEDIPSWRKYTGQTYNGVKGWGWSKALHPEDLKQTVRVWKKAVKEKSKYEVEYRVLRHDGVYRYFMARGIPVFKEDGSIVEWVGTCIDITERKKSEEIVKESSEFNRSLLATLPFGIDIVDEKGNILFMNKKFLSIFGNKSLGKKCWEIYKDDESQCINCPLRKGIKLGKTASLESEGCFNGRTMLISHTGMKYKGKLAVLEVFTDITERKELERRKDEFVSLASHEFKTPLATIKVFSQILQKRLEKPENIYFLKNIIDQVNRLSALVNDLLDASKIENGKLALDKTRFSLDELVKKVVIDFQYSTETHEITEQGETNVYVYADRYRIEQVLINLLSNAIKYSPKGEKVVIRVNNKKECVIVSIQDFGVGIAKRDQKRIFERFFRITKKGGKASGFGLGLYIANEIIKRHGGEIWVESEKGKGSTFYFSLPLRKRY